MYAKIFEQIFDSSIADDVDLRHFFTDLIILADSDGVVNMTTSAIAARTRIPIDKVTALLARLESPDPESQTPADDGRRIRKLDDHRSWGWLIINHKHYHGLSTLEQKKEKTRERVKRYRERALESCNASVTPRNACNDTQTHTQTHTHTQIQTQKKQIHSPSAVDFPASLDNPRFRTAFELWEKHRKEIRKPNTPTARQQQLKHCSEIGTERAVVAIERSIANGYQGIFEANDAKPPPRPKTENEKILALEESLGIKRPATRAELEARGIVIVPGKIPI